MLLELKVRKLINVLVDYKMYHTNPWKIYSHFIGVPLVTFGLFLFLAWFRFIIPDFQMSVAMLFFFGSLIYYTRLSLKIAFYVLCSFGPLLFLAEYCARLPFSSSFQIFLVTFLLGWIFQLAGHYVEGRRPALTDNMMQIFNAPVFLICEVLFLGGKMSDLQQGLEQEFLERKTIKSL